MVFSQAGKASGELDEDNRPVSFADKLMYPSRTFLCVKFLIGSFVMENMKRGDGRVRRKPICAKMQGVSLLRGTKELL